MWLQETQGISPDAPVPRTELNEYFKTYAEDYNTCTLPHEKYYNFEKFMAAERASAASGGGDGGGSTSLLADEEARRREAAARRRQADADAQALFRANMDPTRVAELQRRAELEAQLRLAHKTGDSVAMERLTRALAPPKP